MFDYIQKLQLVIFCAKTLASSCNIPLLSMVRCVYAQILLLYFHNRTCLVPHHDLGGYILTWCTKTVPVSTLNLLVPSLLITQYIYFLTWLPSSVPMISIYVIVSDHTMTQETYLLTKFPSIVPVVYLTSHNLYYLWSSIVEPWTDTQWMFKG